MGGGTPVASEDSAARDSANASGEASSEVLRRRRNRPRSRNRVAYARHHASQREEGEISPSIVEESLENTLPEVVRLAEGPSTRLPTPVVSGESRGQALLKRRWLIKPPSATRFEDLSITQNLSSTSIGKLKSITDRGKAPVETESSRGGAPLVLTPICS